MIKKEEVEKLARLARLEIEDKELEKLTGEIDSILEYVDQIKEASAEISDEPRALVHRNIMREDGEPHNSGKYTKELLEEAPDRERGYVKVKKIL